MFIIVQYIGGSLVVPHHGQCCLPGYIWQFKRCDAYISGGGADGIRERRSSWHPLGGGREYCCTASHAQDGPQKTAKSAMLGKPPTVQRSKVLVSGDQWVGGGRVLVRLHPHLLWVISKELTADDCSHRCPCRKRLSFKVLIRVFCCQ